MARNDIDPDSLISQVQTKKAPVHTRGGQGSKYEKVAAYLAEMAANSHPTETRVLILDASTANSVAQQLNKIGRSEGWRFRTKSIDPGDPASDKEVYCYSSDFDWTAYEAEKRSRAEARNG